MHQSPSDISWEEYEQIREDLEGARKACRMPTQQKRKVMTQEKSIRNQAPRCRRYNGAASCHSRNNR